MVNILKFQILLVSWPIFNSHLPSKVSFTQFPEHSDLLLFFFLFIDFTINSPKILGGGETEKKTKKMKITAHWNYTKQQTVFPLQVKSKDLKIKSKIYVCWYPNIRNFKIWGYGQKYGGKILIFWDVFWGGWEKNPLILSQFFSLYTQNDFIMTQQNAVLPAVSIELAMINDKADGVVSPTLLNRLTLWHSIITTNVGIYVSLIYWTFSI